MIKKLALGCFVTVIVLVLIVVLGLYLIYKTAPDRYNVLIVGTDQREEERSRSDVLMVFSIPKNPKKQTTLLTIPRDTKVEIPGEGLDKITHAYVFGDREEGEKLGSVDLTKETVENFLDIKIDATVEFNFKSFAEIVDMLGGVAVDGQTLDGEKALEIVRDRYRAGGDFARTADQREVFSGLLDKIKNQSNLEEVTNYIGSSKDARLDYNKNRLIRFGAAFMLRRYGRLTLGNIKEEVIPGSGGNSYSEKFGQNLYFWNPDEAELQEMIKRGLK
ncbi:LCP family protein [Patescibacteria group bacterium]|nr:LCP family protein [Patescibacteria group bacterium]